MKRLLSLPLAAMLVALVAHVAFAHGDRFHKSNLTPEQAAKMQQFYAESRAAMEPVIQQIRAKRAELNAQISSATRDKGKIETLARELGALQADLYIERANLHDKLVKEDLPATFRGNYGPGAGSDDCYGARGGKGRGRGMRGFGPGAGCDADCRNLAGGS